jgi:Peptidase M50B-like
MPAAQTATAVRRRRALAVTALVVAWLPVLTVAMVITHEAGHTVMARLLGDGRATFRLYGRNCVGCNLYDSQRLSAWGNVAVSLAGVLGTAVLTVVAVAALGWRARPWWLPRWFLIEVAVLCYAGDFLWQIVQALQQLPVPAREPVGWGLGYTDFLAAVSFFSQATGWSHALTAALGAGVGAVYTAALTMAARAAWKRGRPDRAKPAPVLDLAAGPGAG